VVGEGLGWRCFVSRGVQDKVAMNRRTPKAPWSAAIHRNFVFVSRNTTTDNPKLSPTTSVVDPQPEGDAQQPEVTVVFAAEVGDRGRRPAAGAPRRVAGPEPLLTDERDLTEEAALGNGAAELDPQLQLLDGHDPLLRAL